MQDPAFDLPSWGFAFPGPLRDELTALALAGTKTTTAGLLVEHELDGDPIPRPGDRAILVDSAERSVAIIETVVCRVVRLADVDDRHAIDEGEGYANAHEFRVAHERFWNGYLDDLRVRLGEPGFAITDDTPIVAERFRVLLRLDAPPGPVPVRPAASSEVPGLAGVLARAFAADPMVRWPMVSDDDLPARIRTMFEIVDAPYAGEGWIHVAGDGVGVMSLMPPASAVAPALAELTPDGGERYERFWAWIGSMLPPEPHWLLDQVAVEPAAQGRGIGGAMLRFAIERGERQGLPLCLETGVPGNVPLYERFGFRVMRAADAPDGGPRIWFMCRDPG
jgi:uncharacterized protein YhfF/GNAT superfamily N-acetyltransferase